MRIRDRDKVIFLSCFGTESTSKMQVMSHRKSKRERRWREALAAAFGFAALAVAGPGFRCHCSGKSGRIAGAHLAAHVDWEHKSVSGTADEFSPLVPRFVLVVDYRDLAPDSELRLRWRYLGGKAPKIFRRDLRVLEGSGRVLCGARRDRGTWPPGPYDVEMELGGKQVGRLRFSVTAKTSYRFVGASRGRVAQVTIPSGKERVWLSLEAINPKPETKCRVIWKRKGAEGRLSFYAESELVPIRRTGKVGFELPRPRQGYCAGDYRAEAQIDDEPVARLDFRLVGGASGKQARTDGGRRSRGAGGRTGSSQGRPVRKAAPR